MAAALAKLPYNRSSNYDPGQLVSRLGAPTVVERAD
jgi:hypothetical protein